MSDFYRDREAAAIKHLLEVLARPMSEDREMHDANDFDPWDMIPCLYGSYSSEFDDLAIKVLENLAAGGVEGESLAHEMFREILCTSGFCDYGSSPRVCFPTQTFRDLLPQLIERWKQWRELQWGSQTGGDDGH